MTMREIKTNDGRVMCIDAPETLYEMLEQRRLFKEVSENTVEPPRDYRPDISFITQEIPDFIDKHGDFIADALICLGSFAVKNPHQKSCRSAIKAGLRYLIN